MKNKILIKIYVPSIDEKYELYIPTNETVHQIISLVVKSICEFSDYNLDKTTEHYLMDPETSKIYPNSEIIRDTNIKNSKIIVLI